MSNPVIARLSRHAKSLPSLAYRKSSNSLATVLRQGPGGLFCPGFMSDMTSSKADYLENWFANRNLSFVRFDYTGVGHSVFEEGQQGLFSKCALSFNQWRNDVLTVLDELTSGPQILVGSSMGAWMSTLAAIARPERVAGMVLIAPALDFVRRFYESFPKDVKDKMQTGEIAWMQSPDGSYPVSQLFYDEGIANELLTKPKIPVKCPIRILHGVRDTDVPYKHSLTLLDRFVSQDVDLIYRKSGEHRMSRDLDLDLLGYAVGEVLRAAGYENSSKL